MKYGISSLPTNLLTNCLNVMSSLLKQPDTKKNNGMKKIPTYPFIYRIITTEDIIGMT